MSYTLISELGRGGMGVVWRARDDDTGQVVALKLLRDAYVDDPDYRQRFEHEMAIARRIDSPHVVKVLGFGMREEVPYIAFELVDGPSLRQLLAVHGPYPWPETRALMLQLAEGLADAHATGVVHRDVKPSNVLIDRDGTAKLADFGISHAVDLTRVTRASGLMGTPTYLAPEGPVDARSDLYSLGVIAYEALAGAPPFEGTTYHEVLAAHLRQAPNLGSVPAEARPVLAWLMAKDPLARPQSARQLIRALLGEEPIPDIDFAPTIVMEPRPVPQSATDAGGPASTQAGQARGGEAPPQEAGASDFDWSKVSFRALKKPVSTEPVTVVAGPKAPAAPVSESAGQSPLGARRPRLTSPRVLLAGAVLALVVAVAGAYAMLGSSGPGSTQHPSLTAPPTIAEVVTGSPTPSPQATPTPIASPLASPSATTAMPTPAPAHWQTLGSVPETAFGDTAALLANGKVVIFSTTQGSTHTPTGKSWIVDPDTGAVTSGPNMTASQATPGVVTMSDGSVLVVGGWDASANPVTSAEVLDPSGSSWTALPPMNLPRSQATVTDLGGGRVLVAGGWTLKNGSDSWTATATAEILDRNSNTWTLVSSMNAPRALAAAVRLTNGHVLVTGGDSDWSSTETQTTLSSAEEFDPGSGIWTTVHAMNTPRASHFAVSLLDGGVLVAGGWSDGQELGESTAELYFSNAAGLRNLPDMPGAHAQGRALLLKDGRVMILGGFDSNSSATASVELFDPARSTWSRSASLKDPVYWPCAVVLSDGRVLVAGGWTDKSPSHLIQVLTP